MFGITSINSINENVYQDPRFWPFFPARRYCCSRRVLVFLTSRDSGNAGDVARWRVSWRCWGDLAAVESWFSAWAVCNYLLGTACYFFEVLSWDVCLVEKSFCFDIVASMSFWPLQRDSCMTQSLNKDVLADSVQNWRTQSEEFYGWDQETMKIWAWETLNFATLSNPNFIFLEGYESLIREMQYHNSVQFISALHQLAKKTL